MNIIISSIEYSRNGGIGRYVVELCEALSRQGNNVHVITSRSKLESPGVILHILPVIRWTKSLEVLSTCLIFTAYSRWLKHSLGKAVINGSGAEILLPDVWTLHSVQKEGVKISRKERGFLYSLLKPFEPRSMCVLLIEKINAWGARC